MQQGPAKKMTTKGATKFLTGRPSEIKGRTHHPSRIGTKEIKVGNIQAAQIIANADLVMVMIFMVMVMMVMVRLDSYLVFM